MKSKAEKTTTSEKNEAFSIIENGGKQYLVSDGQSIRLEKLPVKEGETVTFDKVLLTVDKKGKITIGDPYVKGATVTVAIEKQGRAKKISVVHFKAKSNYHKTYGHRQPFTSVKVKSL